MGVFNDLFRLVKAGVKETVNTDYAANLRQSADLAEQFAGVQPGAPTGTHGAAGANPFANMAAYNSMVRGSATVVSITDTGTTLVDTPIYEVVFDMNLPGIAPYRTTYKTVIAAAALPQWQPGCLQTVRASAEDPSAVMLG